MRFLEEIAADQFSRRPWEGALRYSSLIFFVVLVCVAAASGAQFAPGPWYDALAKPSWTPPDVFFPIAWTILYFLVALAGWLIWQRQGVGISLALWAVGLVLNALWSYLMFGRHDIALALIDVCVLWGTILGFIVASWHVERISAYLFVPYLLWVTFACALNAAIYLMNPGVLPV